jgi:D-amino-acid oxidase
MCQDSELPEGFATGWRFVAPLVDMPTYLACLRGRLARAGVVVEARRVDSLDEAAVAGRIVVNCSGIGARELVPDPGLTAIRGQLVVVQNPGITEFFAEDTGPSEDLLHLYPHGDAVVLGGLAVPDDWDLQVDSRPLRRSSPAVLRSTRGYATLRCWAIELAYGPRGLVFGWKEQSSAIRR